MDHGSKKPHERHNSLLQDGFEQDGHGVHAQRSPQQPICPLDAHVETTQQLLVRAGQQGLSHPTKRSFFKTRLPLLKGAGRKQPAATPPCLYACHVRSHAREAG